MKNSQVRFTQLQRFLEGLGFTLARDQQGWRFEHAASQTIFLFRPYRLTDPVYEHDLFLVRSQLQLARASR